MPNTSTQKQTSAGRLLPIHWQDCAWGTNIRSFTRVDVPCPRRAPQSRSGRPAKFSLTPRFSGVWGALDRSQTVLNGFSQRVQTVKTVRAFRRTACTPLKRGVNDIPGHMGKSLCRGAHTRAHKARRPHLMFTHDPVNVLLRLSALPLGSFPFSRLQIRHLFQATEL